MVSVHRIRSSLADRWPAKLLIVFTIVVSFEIGWFYDWVLALLCGILPICVASFASSVGFAKKATAVHWYGANLLCLAIVTAMCGALFVPVRQWVSGPASSVQLGEWIIQSALTVNLGVLEAAFSALLLPKHRGALLAVTFLVFLIAPPQQNLWVDSDLEMPVCAGNYAKWRGQQPSLDSARNFQGIVQ